MFFDRQRCTTRGIVAVYLRIEYSLCSMRPARGYTNSSRPQVGSVDLVKNDVVTDRDRPETDIEELMRERRSYKKDDRSLHLGLFLRRRHQVDATAFAQSPIVQLGDNLFHRPRHVLETPLSAAVNGGGAVRDHIAIPAGAFPTGRRLCSLDRNDLVRLSLC